MFLSTGRGLELITFELALVGADVHVDVEEVLLVQQARACFGSAAAPQVVQQPCVPTGKPDQAGFSCRASAVHTHRVSKATRWRDEYPTAAQRSCSIK